MSSIDEKFKKVIAENAAPEEVKEDAATGDTAIKRKVQFPHNLHHCQTVLLKLVVLLKKNQKVLRT